MVNAGVFRVFRAQPETKFLLNDCQDELSRGATLLGTILSSDKTQVLVMTGHRQAYPLLISLTNLDMDFCMKASNQAFLLLAFLPIPKFIANKAHSSILQAHLIHECLDFILQPLKIVAKFGMMMRDPINNIWYCFTPLAF